MKTILFYLFIQFLKLIPPTKKEAGIIIMILHKKNEIMKRTREQKNLKPVFKQNDKEFFVHIANLNRKLTKLFTIVSPQTVLCRWKKAVKKQWIFPHSKKPGRPRITKKIVNLIINMKKENRSWGYARISGEAKKLVIDISKTSVALLIQNARKNGQIPPTGSWRKFIRSHWKSLYACDFLTVDSLKFKRYYIFFIIKLSTRKLEQITVTQVSNIQFLKNQLSDFTWENTNERTMLIHDNSGELKHFPYNSYKIEDVPIVAYSPNMNAYAERFVKTIRNELLDHFIIFSERQLRTLVNEYQTYYNEYRPQIQQSLFLYNNDYNIKESAIKFQHDHLHPKRQILTQTAK